MVLVFWYYAKAVHVSSTVGHEFIPLKMGNRPSAEDVTHTTSNSQKHPLCNVTLHQPSQILSLLSSTFNFIFRKLETC